MFIKYPNPTFVFIISAIMIYVHPIPYIIKKDWDIEGSEAGKRTLVITFNFDIPIVLAVSTKSTLTSFTAKITVGKKKNTVANNRNDTFISSPIPIHIINRG